jgi:hypothetical protein
LDEYGNKRLDGQWRLSEWPSNAVVGLIDQQPKFAVRLPIAKILLFQRFAAQPRQRL